MKTCPSCGVMNRQESAACCNCYSPLDSGAVANRSSGKQVGKRIEKPRSTGTAKSSGGGGKLLGFFLAILILAGAGFGGYWFFLRPTPEKAIKKLVSALEKNDFDAAMLYLSNDTVNFLNSTGLPALAKQAQQKAGGQAAGSGSENFDLKVDSCTYTDAAHATVAVTSSFSLPANPMVPGMNQPTNQSQSASVPMVLEEGQWKVDGMTWIDNGLKSMTDQNIKQFVAGMKLADKYKGMMAVYAPGLTLDPLNNLLSGELKRRKIDPNSIQPLNIPNMPSLMNMPK